MEEPILEEEPIVEEEPTQKEPSEEEPAQEEPSEKESNKLIEYKIKAYHSAIDDLYKCQSYLTVNYDVSKCMPYVIYDPECEIPKPLETSLNTLYLDKLNKLPYDIIRDKRNSLLKESDWVGLSDVSLSNMEEWKIYRQALRDIPNVNPDATFDIAGNVINVEYPVKPL